MKKRSLWGCFLYLLVLELHCDLFRFQANTPILGFLSPFFDNHGNQTWLCQGDQVRYISDAKIMMDKMCITFFTPDHSNAIDMIIRSDKAIISIPSQQAFGQTLLTVTHPTYTILGENWSWKGNRMGKAYTKIRIRKHARVLFYD